MTVPTTEPAEQLRYLRQAIEEVDNARSRDLITKRLDRFVSLLKLDEVERRERAWFDKGVKAGRMRGLAEAREQARALNTAHRRLRRRYERLRERVLDVARVAQQVGFAEVTRPYDAVFSLAVPTARLLDWLETALSSGAVYEFMAKQWMEHPHARRARLAESCSAAPAEVDCPMCAARPGEPCRH